MIRSIAVFVAGLALAACTCSLETPSGRPELVVDGYPEQVVDRIVSDLPGHGYDIVRVDGWHVIATRLAGFVETGPNIAVLETHLHVAPAGWTRSVVRGKVLATMVTGVHDLSDSCPGGRLQIVLGRLFEDAAPAIPLD
jgi:hypothetical protein